MRRVFLGIDCGTQSTKVVLRDHASGEIVAVGRAPHKLVERDDGTREQDPAWWIDALRVAARDALRGEHFDVRTRRYSDEGLAAIDERRDWKHTLPPVAPSISVVGTLRREAANALGLDEGIPVSAGGGDNMCAAIGCDIVADGPVAVSL